MRECPDAEIRDLLPDLAAGRLAGEARARTEAHVTGCAECAAEAALLRRVRAAAATPAVNVAAIVGALPRSPRAIAPAPAPGVVSLAAHREARERARAPRFVAWRRAAAVATIVLGGAVSFGILRDGGDGTPGAADPVAVMGPVEHEPGRGVPASPAGGATTRAPRVATPAAPTTDARGLGLGGVVAGLSTEEMESLLAELEQFDGVTSADPELVGPVIDEGTGDA